VNVPVETFPALSGIDFVRHAFTLRVPGLDVKTDRETALQRLDQFHAKARHSLFGVDLPFATAQQVHGREVAIVDENVRGCAPGADGLITRAARVCLGIYVADCCAVYLVDPKQRAVGLLHSGKKGTELGIVPHAIQKMRETFDTDPRDLIVQLSPCIRPPHYEIDFASIIIAQCRESGVQHVFDSCENTGTDTQRYYSYRVERGQTGRMLAFLALIF